MANKRNLEDRLIDEFMGGVTAAVDATKQSIEAAASKARRLFLQYTEGTGRIDFLYGPSNAGKRAEILTALCSCVSPPPTIPKSKATWGRFREAMVNLYVACDETPGMPGTSIASVDKRLAMAATKQAMTTKLTPMLERYNEFKAANPDSLLLFRVGDFYELFYDDAKVAAKILGLTITTRDKGGDDPIPMAGFPYHSLQAYLGKLVASGHRVAVCEQVADPKQAVKGMVKREVTRVVMDGDGSKKA